MDSGTPSTAPPAEAADSAHPAAGAMTPAAAVIDTTLFFDLAKRKKWEELEAAWLKFVDAPTLEPSFYTKFITGMAKRGEQGRADQMLALLVQNMTDQGRQAEALKVIRACLPHMPSPDALRETLLALLKNRYGDRPNYERFVKAAQLETAPALDRALNAFLTFLQYDVGETYMHKSWGAGTVTAIDPATRKMVLRFPQRPEAEFTFAGAREYLTRLPRAHFLARLSRDRDAMRSLANDNPADFVKVALRSSGRQVSVADLRHEMTAYLMSDAEWKSWWSRSRERIRVDPWIRFSGSGVNAVLSQRDQAVSVHDAAFDALAQAPTVRKRLDAVRSVVRAHQKSPIASEELDRIEKWLLLRFERAEHDGGRIEALFLLDNLRKIDAEHVPAPPRSVDEIVRESQDLLGALQALELSDYQATVLETIRRVRDDWPAVYEHLLPRLSARLASRGVSVLKEAGRFENLRHLAETLLTNPTLNTEAYLWAVGEYIHDRWKEFAPSLSIEMMMEQLLEHFSDLNANYNPRDESGPQMREDINAIRRFFEAHHHGNTRRIAAMMSDEGARRFYERMLAHPGLDSSERAHIAAALRAERPELEVRAEENLLTSIYHYVTKQSYDAQTRELQRLRTVDIPANSQRIGRAAAMGDLSENAEYDAAKEEQARLMSRVSELEHLIRFARILEADTVKVDQAGPGTRVFVRDHAGAQSCYTLLGVWDADPERHILSYRSPLGAQFLKKKVGDKVELQLSSGEQRQFWIERIENALHA